MSTIRHLVRAGGRVFRRLFQRRLDPHTREIANILRSVPALGHLSSNALYGMASATHRRTYRRGEALYFEGDPGLGLYIVESGRIRLTSEEQPGHSRTLREPEVHEMFGVLSILGDFQRLETAETLTEAQVLGFFRPDLKNVLRRNPRAGSEIVMALARYTASHYVQAIQLIEERDGREVALDTYADVASRITPDASSFS